MPDNTAHRVSAVAEYFQHLQDTICASLSALDDNHFVEDLWQHPQGGGGRTRIITNGQVIEKGGVNFSHIYGDSMPRAATLKRPELAGKNFQAMGVSLVIHPHNPFAPTSHMNVRFFIAGANTEQPVWWFGGGFDLTPYYGFDEDAQHWHSVAAQACAPFNSDYYPRFKQACDDYFHLPHRQEQRGIGGLFFDDLNQNGFAHCFEFVQSVGEHYLPAYQPIVERRKDTPFNESQRQWQLQRRGRYVEFNLVYDRGTLFGLQSGGRTESILMSMPPQVSWAYRAEANAGTPEAELLERYLTPQNWLY